MRVVITYQPEMGECLATAVWHENGEFCCVCCLALTWALARAGVLAKVAKKRGEMSDPHIPQPEIVNL